jgi:hypothetical protein
MDCRRRSFVGRSCRVGNIRITMGILWRLQSTTREGDVAMYSYRKDETTVDGGAAFCS